MKKAILFFSIMFTLMLIGFGVLLESTINESEHEALLKLTQKVQSQFWAMEDLKAELAYCNYHLGNTQSIELNAIVTSEMMKIKPVVVS